MAVRFKDLNEEQITRLREMLENSISIQEIANEFDVIPRTAYNWAINLGLKRGTPTRARLCEIRNSPELSAEYAKDYMDGKPRSFLMEKYGLGRSGDRSMMVYLEKSGMIVRAKKNKPKSSGHDLPQKDGYEEQAREMARLSKAGITNSKIAEKLNISEKTVISNIGLHGFIGGRKPKPQVIQTLPIGTKVWALQPTNTRNLTLRYKKVPATIEKVYPKFYDCVTDNGHRVSVQIVGAERVEAHSK